MSEPNSLKGSISVEQPNRIADARDRLLSGLESTDGGVRTVIQSSWQRCLKKGMDPEFHQPQRLDESALERLWLEDEELIAASDIIMNEAHQLLADSGTIMHIVAPGGVILRCDGDPATLEHAGEIDLVPGADWGERSAGTNAIGTALSIGGPVQVHAQEHFCHRVSNWTCSASVIRDPFFRGIRGVVNISGLKHTQHDYCLALAISTAHRIEGQLVQAQLSRRDLLLGLTSDRFTRIGTDAVLLFDAEGHLLRANAQADQVLALRGIKGDLRPHNLLLSLGEQGDDSDERSLLAQLDKDWIEPLIHEGRLLGYLAVISAPHLGGGKESHNPRVQEDIGFARILGRSRLMAGVIEQARRLAQAPIPILLQGETGVGKELFARAIHETGANRKGAFVALNCGGLSRDLLAAELFGYVEGAFTGARRGGMMGKIEAANGGTLFLDEIGEMPLDLQPLFLRVLQESEICRVGETTPRKVNFRLVAATNREMMQEVAQGRFRMDLYYRVSSMKLRIPPLRERTEDIPLLAERLVQRLSQQYQRNCKGLSPELLQLLQSHDWPGNIRELSNLITAAFFLAEGPLLCPQDLPEEFVTGLNSAPLEEDAGPLQEAEREMIEQVIREQHGNLTQAARQLKIAKSTLYSKLKKYGISRG